MARIDMSKYVTPYGSFMGEQSSMLWSSLGYEQQEKSAAKKTKKDTGNRNEATDYRVGETLAVAPKKDTANIWKSVAPNSRYKTNPQQTIENLRNLNQGDNLLSTDLEILGTFNGDPAKGQIGFYSPTELAITRHKVINDRLLTEPVHSGLNGGNRVPVAGADYLSLFIKPTSKAEAHLRALLTKAETLIGGWSGLSEDERRTLNDLALYSGDDPYGSGMLQKENGMTFIYKQNRAAQVNPKGTFGKDILRNARQGLETLVNHGTPAAELVRGLDAFFRGVSDYKLSGYNIQQFDIPVLRDYLHSLKGEVKLPEQAALERLIKDMSNVQGIDVYQTSVVTYKNSLSILGNNLKLETIAQNYGIDVGQAHMGLDDTRTPMGVFNQLVQEQGLAQIIKDGTGVNPFGVVSYDPTNLKAGDQLIARKGIGSNNAGKYDGVFRHEKVYKYNKDGSPALDSNGEHVYKEKFVPAYDIKVAPVYNNVKYQIEGFFENFQPDKKGPKLNGVLLRNLDEEGLFHFVGREEMVDLQNIMQEHFVDASKISDTDFKHGKTARKQDKARRRWDKMFEGGGFNRIEQNLRGLKALDYARGKGLDEEKTNQLIKKYASITLPDGRKISASDSFVQDLRTMEGRLRAEQKYLTQFVQEVNNNGKIRGNFKHEEVVLKNFRSSMDQTFGENVTKVELGHHNQILTGVQVAGKEYNIRLNDNTTIQSSLRQMLYDGGRGTQTSTARVRIGEILKELEDKKAIKPEDARRLRDAAKNIGDRKSDTAYYVILNEISSLVEREATRNPQNMVAHTTSSIHVEDVANMNRSRQGRLNQHWDNTGHGIIQSSIASVNHMKRNSWGGKRDGKRVFNSTDPRLDQIIENHDRHFQMLLDRTGIGGTAKTKSSRAFIEELARSYSTRETSVAFMYDARQKGLTMLVAPTEVAKEVFGLNAELPKILQDNRVAAIPLPMFTSNLNLSTHGRSREQNRLAQFTAIKDGEQYYIGSGAEEAASALIRSKNAIQRKVLSSGKDAEGLARTVTNHAINNMSIRNRYVSKKSKEEMGRFRESQGAMWLRSSMLDVTAFAEDWYESFYGGLKPSEDKKKKHDIGRIRQAVEENPFTSFIDHMRRDEIADFQRHIDEYVFSNHGLKTDAHSAKDTYVGQYKRATNDVRDLTAAGYLNPMARENLMKSVNYLPMSAQNVVNQLRKSLEIRYRDSKGNVDYNKIESEIERYLTRGVVTETAEDVLEKAYIVKSGGVVGASGKIPYLNARVARMHSLQLANILQSPEAQAVLEELEQAGKKIDPARLSTYDGMGLVRESTAQALQPNREKMIQLQDGENPSEKIRAMFEGKQANQDGLIELLPFEQRNLRIVAGQGSGPVTVGDLVKEATIFKGHQESVYIAGYNPSENKLLLSIKEKVSDSVKGVSDAGDRFTYKVVPDKLMDVIAPDLDAVLEPTNTFEWDGKKYEDGGGWKVKRGTAGVEVAGLLNLVQDEVRQRITVGTLAKEEAMLTMKGLVEKHFNADEMVQIQNDQLLVSKVFGIDNAVGLGGLKGFLEDASKPVAEGGFGIDPEILGLGDATIQRSQIGLALGDVENWERSVGAYEGKSMSTTDGLVKWGPKEIGMITARANRILGTDSNAITSWLKSYTSDVIAQQNAGSSGYVDGLNRGILAIDRQGVATGDVVIRTSGVGSSFKNPMNSRVTGGVTEVSMDIFNNLPESFDKDAGRVTVGELQKTIVSLGKAGDEIFQQSLEKNSGVALFQLPEGLSRKYTPFFDIPLLPGREEAAANLSNLQKSQMNVWRTSREYMNLQGSMNDATGEEKMAYDEEVARARTRVEDAVVAHEEEIRTQGHSKEDGSILKNRVTAHLDMSGQFRIQGINPFMNMEVDEKGQFKGYKGKYEEGTVYVNKHRLLEMIDGAEKNIMETILEDRYTEGMGTKAMRKEIVDYAKTNGLYGLVGRFPTIKEDATMSLKVMVDDTLTKDDRGAYLTIGTAEKLKADYDGDFLSQVLAHYKSDNAKKLHKELEIVYGNDVKVYEARAAEIYTDLNVAANERGVTVGQLTSDTEFMKQYSAAFTARTRTEDALESLKARLGKGSIGQADNLRLKFLSLTEATHDVLRQEGNEQIAAEVLGQPNLNEYLVRQRKIIEELGSRFSQDLISSKKFDIDFIDNIIKEDKNISPDIFKDEVALSQERVRQMDLHTQAIDDMTEGFKQIGTTRGNARIRQGEKVLGLFKDAHIDLNGEKIEVTLAEMLEEAGKVLAISGQSRWSSNASLAYSTKTGPSMNQVTAILKGEGGTIIPTAEIQIKRTEETFRNATDEGVELFERSVMYNLQNNSNPNAYADSLTGVSSRLADIGGGTVADDTFKRLGGMFSQFGSSMNLGAPGFSSIAIGAGVFGGLWAGSALFRGGPTPEAMQDNIDSMSMPVTPDMLGAPTARVTPNGENININISAKNAQNLSSADIGALVQHEMNSMMNTQLNVNMNVNDNTQKIDQRWLQDVVANAINSGYAY